MVENKSEAIGRAVLLHSEQQVAHLRAQLAAAEQHLVQLRSILGEAHQPLPSSEPDLSDPRGFDLSVYDSRWKTFRNGSQEGGRLTKFGRAALHEAFRRGKTQAEVRALFDISSAAASTHFAEFQAAQRGAGRE